MYKLRTQGFIQHCGEVFDNRITANFLENLPVKFFKNQLTFDSYSHEFGVSLAIETRCR